MKGMQLGQDRNSRLGFDFNRETGIGRWNEWNGCQMVVCGCVPLDLSCCVLALI